MYTVTNHLTACATIAAYDIRDFHGVMDRFGLKPEDLLELCGGIPIPDLQFLHVTIDSASEHTLRVAVASDRYSAFRTINFSSKRIFNDTIRVFTKGEHIGTSLFINQVVVARQLGFRRLTVFAADYDVDERIDGYYRWARLGYQMTDRNDLEDFVDLMRYCPSPAKTLSELVLTESGYAFWKEQGFAWNGEFLLADGSPSMVHLQQYLEIKGIVILL